jgi:putative nucleotidyltransferase with HDIG domain
MTLSIDNRFLRRTIEKAVRDLPALPAVVSRVLVEMEKPNTGAAQLEKFIATDQALTMKVLRVVNSAYYGLPGQVSSLGQAIVILGQQQIRNLLLSVGAISNLHARTPRQLETLRQFWKHSFSTASAAQNLAHIKGLSSKDIEVAFVGGLLHDIGRLFLFVNFTEVYDDLVTYAGERDMVVEEAETMFLGMSHGEIGEEMARTWRLPEVLCNLIGRHEGPFQVGSEPLEMVVHYSDCLTKHLYFPPESHHLIKVDSYAQEWLALSPEDVEAVRQGVEQHMQEAIDILGLAS